MIEVNYLAVFISAIAVFALGALWYGALFGKYWRKLMNFSEEDMKNMPLTPAKAMTLGFISTLLMVFVLSHFVNALSAGGFVNAITLVFWIWLGFIIPTIAGSWLWEGKSFKLFLFNAVYQFISIALATVILASWQ